MANVKITVEGMSCEHCENRVVKAVTAIEGVVSAVANAKEGYVLVDGGDLSAVKSAIEDAGYDVIA